MRYKEHRWWCVQAEQWAARHERFPEHTPVNKEYYLLRSIFEERFPGAAALKTVPKGLSIACSSPEAVAWDPEWANIHDISGRAVAVHDASEGYETATDDDSIGFGAVDQDAVVAALENGAGNGNGAGTREETSQRAVKPRALKQAHRQPCVLKPLSRARGHATLSGSTAGRIGLRFK